LDDAWSEYRAIDGESRVTPSEKVRRDIAHGELLPQLTERCIEKAGAFAAMCDFLGQG
jgi:hypothetical protein